MPRTHRKLHRKELKEPDEFLSFVAAVQEFLTSRLREVLLSVAIVGAVGLVAVSIYAYERHRDRVVAAQFYSAFSALNAKQYRVAEEGFRKLAADEPGRELGRLSRLYLGSVYLSRNDLPHARDAFVAYLAEAHDPYFRGLALMSLGVVYERMGELGKAENTYRQAMATEGRDSAATELAVARMLELQGNRAAAVSAYKQFLESHPFASQRQDVMETLARLGAPFEERAGLSR